MKRCPKCHRFGIEYDPYINSERCLWKDCSWINHNNIDVDKVNHGIRFKKFIRSIGRRQ